ncbi:Ig-like domain-containing protein [Flavobacterium ardleyense]|uniref:Ig-like domain-containing protein n=1 Tax=Flavobacterium ardleyense TaxID=2038737 RepID=UPI00298D29FA|nr:Ig-like domain-containing protein [Flavobacterium ardleyense]
MFRHIFTILLTLVVLSSCAKRASISGGLKDTIAPVMKQSYPPNYTTNFEGNEIKIVFDEYIKLKNLSKQLIVSPPMQRQPIITPTTASKTITIKILDTLKANTTYSFNFGKSIEDNNEGNPYQQFKYVFSTGSIIDSLKLRGRVFDAYNKDVEPFVSVMLYEFDENYTDSLIYKQRPRYITNTLDSIKIFEIENIKPGKYKLIALKDKNSNNKYDPKADKIGFLSQTITMPTDSLFTLKLFKESRPLKANKPAQTNGSKLTLGYEGNFEMAKIKTFDGNSEVPNVVTKVVDKDSVLVWFPPSVKDSIRVTVSKGSYTKDFSIRLKEQKSDSLVLNPRYSSSLPLREEFALKSATPLTFIDSTKITVRSQDSTAQKFSVKYDEFLMELKVKFKKEPLEKYKIQFLPGAVKDFYNRKNDTLVYSVSTKNTSDYGNLRIAISNIKTYPVIVELSDVKGATIATSYLEEGNIVDFNLIDPMLYNLRIIYDTNKNGRWDEGNFLENRQAEEVIYFPTSIDVRANWDVDQPFILK